METVRDWLIRAREFLDGYGFGAWLAAMVLGFVLFPLIGLALLGYMLWSGRMGCWKGKRSARWERRHAGASTGNAAFDAYREDTLRRLEDERAAFTDFLDRLRRAKDQAEFDQFMADRGTGSASGGAAPSQGPAPEPGPAPQSGGGFATGGQNMGPQNQGGFNTGPFGAQPA